MITSTQSRMARAALGWGIRTLAAKAEIGVATANRFETGARQTIPATRAAIRRAFEDAGIVFSEYGVELQPAHNVLGSAAWQSDGSKQQC